MTTKDIRKRVLGAGSALQVLALVGAGFAAGAIIATPAAAQDLTAGVIAGTVTDESGGNVAGATVTLTSQDQGFTRNARTASSGGFRFVGLPAGRYTVVVDAEGLDSFTANDVVVQPSQTSDLSIGLTATGNVIVVTGATIQSPFTGTTSGVSIDVQELAKRVPVGRDVTNLMLLAPGTSTGDSGFDGNVSIGGSSVAENAYYINGLNITNFDNYLGGAKVPFDFYKSVEVKSGGYPAEFGRATGGIVNAVSKSGGNEFQAAIHLNWQPNFLRSDAKDLLTCDEDGCQPYTNRRYDKNSSYSAIVEASGPIIKDRLFVYGLLEMRSQKSLVNDRASSLAYQREENDPFWAIKVDAFPIDNHHLEFTIFDTRNSERNSNLAYSEDAVGVPSYGVSGATFDENSGGVNYVAKYTGTLTDWFTISGAYGRMRDRFDTTPLDPGADLPFIQNATGTTVIGPNGDPVPQAGTFNAQSNSITDDPYRIEREFYRADADFFVTAFGDHHIRMGFDQENNSLNHIAVSPGGSVLCNGFLTDEACTGVLAASGSRLILRSVSGVQMVEVNYYNSGGSFDATNRAFYIQDEWKPFDRLTLSLGVRRDDFKLNKSDGSLLVNLDKNYAPRLGATFDMWDDYSGKIRAFYGHYYLPVASNTAFRQASPEVYFRERFEFDGWDANGLPILGDQVTDLASYQATCPFALTSVSSGFNCTITGDGSVPETGAGIAHNLKATKESEWIIGYEHRLGDWTVGLSYTHRNMDRSAEDMAIDRAVINYCEAEGIEGCDDIWTGYHQYVITNPGSDLVVDLSDPIGDETEARTVTITAAQLAAIGFPKASRKYDAVELMVRRPWDGKWSFEANYTWSKSRGNSEGFVQSDFQQDDSGITQDFDQPGFIEGAYGLLPNHRRHRFKAWGAYSFFDGFTLGTNLTVESPRPLSCFGFHPGSDLTDGSFENGYQQASHYCGGVLSPRGTAQKTQWTYKIDLSARYETEIPSGQQVTFRADVFNLLNTRKVQDRYELGDIDEDYNPHPNFGQPRNYMTPRSVRLGMDINF
ncbi:MAG TPA: TonB-dependent receptor [Croceibacterium sp.]|nr:TonB-dependent receptor [Croceibacterium sp.]